jgi:hypothetical protein
MNKWSGGGAGNPGTLVDPPVTSILYTIDKPVGLNAINAPDDVLLLQFLLLLHSEMGTTLGYTSPTTGKGVSVFGGVPLDGKFSLTLLGFMLMFQLKERPSVTVDGVFKPIDLSQLPSGTGDSMLKLNSRLMFDYPFADITKHPKTPPRLAVILKDFK